MSKKILSAVLAIAMMFSMFAGVVSFAAPDYEADRKALGEAIKELYIKGPAMSETAVEYIYDQLKIVSSTDVLERNKVFKVPVTTYYFAVPEGLSNGGKVNSNDPSYFLKGDVSTDAAISAIIPDVFEAYMEYAYNAAIVEDHENLMVKGDMSTWCVGMYDCSGNNWEDTSYLSKVTEGIVMYAASVWYFGSEPNMEEIVDKDFNVKRNAVVKEATALVNGYLDFLRGQVGGYSKNTNTAADENKPAHYAAAAWAWRQQYATKYNANYGINPFEDLSSSLLNDWWSILAGNNVVQAQVFPGWYTFSEMRADSNIAPLLNAFERLYRAAQTVSLKGVLYHEFMTETKVGLEKAWKDLINALLARYTFNAPQGVSALEVVKVYHTLKEVVDFYDLYISDAYQNIYTSTDKELLYNVAYAKMLINWIDTNASATSIIYFMGVDTFTALTNDIIAGIEASEPSTSNLAVSNEEIDAAVALINQASVLLDAWKFWGSKAADTAERSVYDALKNAIASLKVMIPYDEASKAVYEIKANSTSYVAKDFDGSDIKMKNNAATIEFAPNYFAYVRFVDALNAAYSAFTAQVDIWNADLETLDPVGIANNYNKQNIRKFLFAYDFLAGYQLNDNWNFTYTYFENHINTLDPFKYQRILDKAILPYVIGPDYVSEPEVNDDKAYDQYMTFRAMFREACVMLNGGAAYNYFTGVDFTGNSWNWANGKVEGLKNGWDVIYGDLKSMLGYLTVDMAELLNIYKYVTLTLWNHFDIKNDTVYRNENAYPGGNHATKGSLLYNFRESLLKVFSMCQDNSKVNIRDLTIAYNRFLSNARALLTEDRGQPLLEQFLADIQSWAVTQKVNLNNEPWALYEKLVAVFGSDGRSILRLPTDDVEPYLYYNLTLKVVLNNSAPSNKYSWKDQFMANIYNPIANASQALTTVKVSEYDTEWVEKYNEVRNQCGYFLKTIDLNAANGMAASTTDIPLYAVLNLYNQLLEVLGEQADHTVSALELYKITALDPVLAAAYGKNAYDYDTSATASKAYWNAYTKAYSDALVVRNDVRAPKSKIDEAAAALVAAVEDLAKIAKTDAAATLEDLNAKIAEAEALVARADVEAASIEALEAAVKAAKKFVAELKYVTTYLSSDFDAEIAKLDAAIDAANEELFLADDLAAYLAEVAAAVKDNADDYTADSYKAFVLAYNEAKAVAESTTNASAYVAAKALVEAAYAALEAPEMSKTLIAAAEKLAELKAVDTKDYSADSVAAFNAAVAALEAGIEGAVADDALLELIANAYIAKANLAIANPTTLDD